MHRTELEPALKEKIADSVIAYRNKHFDMMKGRFLEILPLLRSYSHPNNEVHNFLAVDWAKVEIVLVNGGIPVIGEMTNGKWGFLGVVKNYQTITDPSSTFVYNTVTKNDIDFKVPEKYILDDMEEISLLDGGEKGNFICMKDKFFSKVSDTEIINFFAHELAHIKASRYSLILQAKMMTLFRDDLNSETANQMISAIFNGSPFLTINRSLDIEEFVIKIDNPNLANNLTSLKNEFQNVMTEMCSMLGINSLAVDKASGVSDTEAKSNSSFTTANANVKLKPRQHFLNFINRRMGSDIVVKYDDEAVSELSDMLNKEGDNIE